MSNIRRSKSVSGSSRNADLPKLRPLAASVRSLIAGGLLFGAPPTVVNAAPGMALPKPSAVLASMGVASYIQNGTKGIVDQQTERAILNWESFNVGRENSMEFRQPSTSSIALNKIHDANPSQILGELKTTLRSDPSKPGGQLYLYNKNGFVFGKESRVNVNSLVATTLDISDDVFDKGVTKVLQQSGTAALEGDGSVYRVNEEGQQEKIEVHIEAGAEIKTTDANGRILVFAPSILNEGTVQADDGQVVMAAATDKVYLQEAGSGSGVRGLLVEVGTGGDVKNLGKIAAKRGNVTLMGFAVNQDGNVSASTSVRVNGSIRLLAREGARVTPTSNGFTVDATRTYRDSPAADGLGTVGKVELGGNSVTEVTLDESGGSAVVGQTQSKSRVELMGKEVRLKSGSRITAPSGRVDIAAIEHPDQRETTAEKTSFADTFQEKTTKTDTRVILESGSVIDVSGVKDVPLSMESNVVEVELRSFELRDSPLLRSSLLNGRTLLVDRRKGTRIADISGALARIEQSVEERNTAGGTVNLFAAGDVVAAPGSRVDISGGSVKFADGYIDTTHLIVNGRMVEIGDADPNLVPEQVLGEVVKTYDKWGQTRTWRIPGPFGRGRFETGYVEGKPGGTLNIDGQRLFFAGDLRAETVNGRYQRLPGDRTPGSSWNIDLTRFLTSPQRLVLGNQASSGALAAIRKILDGKVVPITQDDSTGIDTGLVAHSGVENLSITTYNRIDVPRGSSVVLPEGGSLKLAGGEVDIDGTIDIPGGDVELTSLFVPGATIGSGSIRVDDKAGIDVSGQWINDGFYDHSAGAAEGPVTVDGGKISIKAKGDVTLASGAVLRADGGAWLDRDGILSDGLGGRIELEAAGVAGSNMILDGTLSALALRKGGSLVIGTNEVVIGNRPPSLTVANAGGLHPLWLKPSFFQKGGFSEYHIGSNMNGLVVAPGTVINPSTRNLQLSDAMTFRTPSRRRLNGLAKELVLSGFERNPVDLSLSLRQTIAGGRSDAAVVLAKGAGIVVEPRASVDLSSDRSIVIDGHIVAPGGDISVTVTPPAIEGNFAFLPDQGIFVGSGARISAAGTLIPKSNVLGLLDGDVLSGGTVTLTANRGFVVTEKGSVIDVTGGLATLDVLQPLASGLGGTFVKTTVFADSGKIGIAAAEGFVLDGAFRASPQGASAAAGELVLNLDSTLRADGRDDVEIGLAQQTLYPRQPREIELRAGRESALPSNWSIGDDLPADLYGRGLISSRAIMDGRFGALEVRAYSAESSARQDEIHFKGDVALSMQRSLVLNAPVIAWEEASASDKGVVRLNAPYLSLGYSETLLSDESLPAGQGRAVLAATASLIDMVGVTTTRGFGVLNLSSKGDIRLRGTPRSTSIKNESGQPIGVARDFYGELVTSANVNLRARQIYPTTASKFRLAITDSPNGVLTTSGNGAANPVLSAGGNLEIDVPIFHHDGVIKAPFGEIQVHAGEAILSDGSRLSVSGEGALVPFGRLQAGQNWLYPWSSDFKAIYDDAPPERSIFFDVASLDVQKGSTVDISGGGDLYAYQFIPGPGGSVDVLDPLDPLVVNGEFSYQEKFAILPSLGKAYAPYDHTEFPTSGLKPGDSIYLSGAGGLPNGEYALLPAHYALLPGAYLVTPQKTAVNMAPGEVRRSVDGTAVVAGYRKTANTSVRDATWSGFAVEAGSVARTRSEYQDTTATAFHERRSAAKEIPLPVLPRDAGQFSVAVENRLVLEGNLLAKMADGGRGGRFDISADEFSIVLQRSETPGGSAVEVEADELSRFGAESILLGGFRRTEDGVRTIDVKANTVTVEEGTRVAVDDLMLVARDGISVLAGAELISTGRNATVDETLQVAGDSALIRLSSNQFGGIERSGVAGSRGYIAIESGSVLRAGGSMVIDAAKNTQNTLENRLLGDVEMDGGTLYLAADSIGLGDAPSGVPGFILSADRLVDIRPANLILASQGDVKLYSSLGLDTEVLDIRAAGIANLGAPGSALDIHADSVFFSNPGKVTGGVVGGNVGELDVAADFIGLGEGEFSFRGFSGSNWVASDRVVGSGGSKFSFSGDLALAAGVITGAGGADTHLDLAGHKLTVERAGTAGDLPESAGFGARFAASAGSILFNGIALMPGGTVELSGESEVSVGNGGVLNVAGTRVEFSGVEDAFVPGGKVRLYSSTGDVAVLAGSSIDVSSAGAVGDAGEVVIAAPKGTVTISGELSGSDVEGYRSGSFSLDAKSIGGSFGSLLGQLDESGFHEELDIRQGVGNLVVSAADTVRAHRIALSADQGNLSIGGTLDASGGAGGRVELFAGDELKLVSGGKIQAMANGAGQEGGQVLLSATDADGVDGSKVIVESGAVIDVSGSSGGTVTLRALQVDMNGDAKNDEVAADFLGTVLGAATKRVEAVRKESFATSKTISSADLKGWASKTTNFMVSAPSIEARIGNGFSVIPGLEVSSVGDLILNTAWDFKTPATNTTTWNYTGVPGALTLRAGGNLTVAKSLSDGFAAGTILNRSIGNLLQPGESWSYRLVAGADVPAADFHKVARGRGDLTVSSEAVVRTGTGDISVGAGGNLTLADESAAIYTAGRPDVADRYGTLPSRYVADIFYGEYPIDGGDISVRVEGDVHGAVTKQFFDWMVRTGDWGDIKQINRGTAWAVAFDLTSQFPISTIPATERGFRQNIGALGGGNVDVQAGGSLYDLSVVIPTTGKQHGKVLRTQLNIPILESNVVEVNGGGDLTVKAGGDILGGLFYAAKGNGVISADGSVGGGKQYTTGPLFALGDSNVQVRAGGNVSVGAAFNPTLVKERMKSDIDSFFSTYSPASNLGITSLGGKVTLANDNTLISSLYTTYGSSPRPVFSTGESGALTVYPGSLSVRALDGDIEIQRPFVLFPSSTGQFELLAGESIYAGNQFGARIDFGLSDADPGLLPSPEKSTASYASAGGAADRLSLANANLKLVHATKPVHESDFEPARIVAKRGDIVSSGKNQLFFYSPKPLYAEAGRDIRDVSFDVQNLREQDISTIRAGRDFNLLTDFLDRDTGAIKPTAELVNIVRISGPGELQLLTGRDIDLGAAKGIESVGNTRNTALPEGGAKVTLVAGLSSSPGYDAFIDKYVVRSTLYWKSLAEFILKRGMAVASDDELPAALKALKREEQLGFVLSVLFNELRESGTAAAKSGDGDYSRGFEAIETLFPGSYSGDIELFFSKIYTLAGGDINLLAPGGMVNAGLAVAVAGEKKADQLGIVALREGDINSMVDGNFEVNQSRVSPLDGGDVAIWSSNGDIDAGKGAKSALAIPQAQFDFDADGNLIVDLGSAISGSGIRTAANSEGKIPGDVFLFAPRGVVDASEAGIGGTNVTIAATAVLGANNIDVGGTATGIPVTSNVSLAAGLTGVSNVASSASQMAEQTTTNSGKNQGDEQGKHSAVSLISAEVVGFGDCSVGDVRGGKAGCGG